MTDWNETIQKMNQRQEDEELLHRKRLEEEREQERLEQEAAMTDTTDYTQRPEVLAALGYVWKDHPDSCLEGKFWYRLDKGYYFSKLPAPTMQELWEGLCKACEEAGFMREPRIKGLFAVVLSPNGYDVKAFMVSEYGTLANAIAAALYTVLQQGEKKEG